MIIVGELINSTRTRVKEAIENKDEKYIRKLVQLQSHGGASFIDVNSAMSRKSEIEDLAWLTGIVQSETDLPLAIDTPNSDAMEQGIKLCKIPPMINSITNEPKRERLIKLAKDYNCSVVALPLGGFKKMPLTVKDRMEEAKLLLEELLKCGIEKYKIYLDPLILGVGSNSEAGRIALETVRAFKKEFPGINTICGVSNISFGLPDRRLFNRTYLPMMIEAGLDGAITDPSDEELMQTLKASLILTGREKFSREKIREKEQAKSLLEELKGKIEEGLDDEAKEITENLLKEQVNAKEILASLIKAMEVTGEKYSSGEIYVPEMMMSASAMKECLTILKPHLLKEKVEPVGLCVIGTVEDDLHDIGQNLVSMMLEGAGFEVFNLGADVSTEEFLKTVEEKKPDLLGLSAMLTTTMVKMEEIISSLKAKGLREKVRVIVGGAPLNQEFADEIGADGYGKDATEAVFLAKKLIVMRDA
jgi:5-methyltetrahydrofolate--homocysteine methyltransferase